MYKKEFEALLKSKKLPNYFLFRSSSDFLNELYVKFFIRAKNCSEIVRFYYDEYNFEQISNLLAQNSLFNDSSLIHLKTDKAISPKEAAKLVEICEKNQTNSFIYELNDENCRVTNDFIKSFKTNFVRFFQPNNDEEALNLLGFYAKTLKLNFNQNALLQLYRLQNFDLNLSASEINKFANLNLELNEQNLKSLVNPLNIISLSEFFELVFELKDFRKSFVSLQNSSNFNEIALINLFYSSFFKIFEIYLNLKISSKIDMMKILGYKPPFSVENSLKSQAYKLNDWKIEKIFKSLNRAEFELKMKINIDKSLVIMDLLVEIQKILSK